MNVGSQQLWELSPAQARTLHLAAQGLLRSPRRRARPADLLAAIERMRMLQIDTIHVVARSPYLVLFSRLGAYPQEWLDGLLESGQIAECWAHEASFVPASDYPWHRAFRSRRSKHWAHRHAVRMQAEHAGAMRELLGQVREHGPVRASDLRTRAKGSTGWWEWSPEKRWLEAWFALGEVMVERRERFQRVYDVSERVLPKVLACAGDDVSDSEPDTEVAYRRFVVDAVRALGVARAEWVGDYHRLGRVSKALLEELAESGELVPVVVQGWDVPAWVHRDHLPLAREVAVGKVRASHCTVLSPFDPVVWDRDRLRALFGFDYALECYTPAPRRRYGYFVLPVLCRGRLVARVDAKAHRREGVFEIKALYLEPQERPTPALVGALTQALAVCAAWHGAPQVLLGSCEPGVLRRPLQTALKQWLGHSG